MDYQVELLRDVFDEMEPLFKPHYDEIAHFKDIPMNVNKEEYLAIEDKGLLKLFTVRDNSELVGYNIFFVKNNIRYSGSKQAVQDVVFIRKDKRGQGRAFLKWCDEKLKNDGVDAVYHHMKASSDWSKILVERGYELVDQIAGS